MNLNANETAEIGVDTYGRMWVGKNDGSGCSWAVSISGDEAVTLAEIIDVLRERYRDLETALKDLKGGP